MLALALAAAVAASSGPAPAPKPRVLVMDFRNDGVDAKVVAIIRDALTAHLAKLGSVDVMSTEDVRRSVDIDQQKSAVLGCSLESCMAEVANALGADYILFGNIGTLGGLFEGNMSLLDAKKSASIGRETIEVHSIEELPSGVRDAGDRLIAAIPGVSGAAAASAMPGAFSSPFLYVGAAGVVVGAAGIIVGAVEMNSAAGVIGDEVSLAATKDKAVNDFNTFTFVAGGGLVLAAAGAAAATYAFLE